MSLPFRGYMPQAQVISFPTPLYSNPPIAAQFFTPSRFVISNISLGTTTTVTTILNMNYLIGQQVRLLIPNGYGCVQLSGKTGYVLSFPSSNQVLLSIDSSRNVDPFIAANLKNSPSITAIGDINSGITTISSIHMTSPTVPGAFINIS